MRLSISGLVIGALLAFGSAAVAAENMRQIVVSGEGQVAAAPDLATISLGVTQEAKTAAEALDAVSNATRGVLARLKELAIADRDMQTSQLTLNPKWTYRKVNNREYNEITGYTASNMVTVKVRDLGSLGTVLDGVVRSGANNFNGLRFGFDDPQTLEDDARKAAVKDALRKASQLAEAAGVTLGPIQNISESGGRARPVAMAESRMAMDSAVPIAEGELSLTSRVSVVFSIAD